MMMFGKAASPRFVLGLALIIPAVTLAAETEGNVSVETGMDQPSPAGQAPAPESDDSGVKSRAAGQIKPLMQAPIPIPLKPADLALKAGPAPANVTLTSVTPTNLQIAWSPSPGAVRYLISRNGAPDIPIEANAGLLQGNRFLYTDVGRRPAMLHTYSVTALFNPPLLPGKSAPVQIVSPPALPPQSFKATVSGPNAVAFNWTQRPEASSYVIIRSGGNLPATPLEAKGGPYYLDQNLPPGHYTYMIQSVIYLANGEGFLGEFSTPIAIQIRPFNIVAVGDSVMWGQGLKPEHKFTSKVKDWLQGVLGKSVSLNSVAHSGAVTYPIPGEAVMEYPSGEVPSSFPSISDQAKIKAPALVSPSEVDLVLVDGGINNLNIKTILNPFGSDDELRANTRAYCGAGVQNVLTDVARTFPNAKVAVTGYFPIASQQSDLAFMVPLWATLLPLLGIPPDPILGGFITLGYRERSAARSDLFFQESTSSLRLAVNTMNSMSPPLGGNRFRFAPLSVGPENAYAAPNTWLWLIPTPPLVQDEVFGQRVQACQGAGKSADPFCIEASLGHPNVTGAQAYTDALKSVLTPFIPEWRAAHIGPMTAPDDSLILSIQQGPLEVDGGWLTITASDGPSGPPLSGTIQMNGLPAGTLGVQTRYGFQEKNPTEILVRVDVPSHRPRSFTIPIRTLSVAVNVINNGNPRTAVVTATDSLSGQLRNGTVIVNPSSPTQFTGATGQPLTYPSCGQITTAHQFAGFTLTPGPAPCAGTVHVSFYPDASYQDVPGAINLAIQGPVDILRKPGTSMK